MINAIKKGKEGELELANILKEKGYETRRGRQYNGLEGKDIVGLPGIHPEVKRVEHLNVSEAMKQAIKDADVTEFPIVFHRKNREDWLVTMRLEDWLELYKGLYVEILNEKKV
jgi:Holliday junction resolvase